ncbi:MAG: ANTAR domain-containing response regulator [Gaiellaceae bacterium]
MSTELNADGRETRADGVAHLIPPGALLREIQRLRTENAQLVHALESRIVIEQAKGVLRERYGLSTEAAFELLRHAARSNRTKIHALAAKVVASSETPPEFGRVLPPQARALTR